jgi:hypothetical protein
MHFQNKNFIKEILLVEENDMYSGFNRNPAFNR